LKTWVNKHKGIKSIRIKSTVTAVDESKSTHPTFKEVFYFSLDRQAMYSWAMDESEHRLFGKSRTGAGNTVTTLLTVGSDLHELIRTLKQKEIPIKTDEDLASLKLIQERVAAETEFLSRWNGAPAWVIGDSNGPQLWVEKDSFLPLRLICSMASPQGTQSLDLRFENYRHYREIPVARTTSVADRSGKVLITSQVTDVVINPDISSLKAYDREADGKFTEAGSKSSDELRELIRLYYEVVR
jgi:hypothetical protein